MRSSIEVSSFLKRLQPHTNTSMLNKICTADPPDQGKLLRSLTVIATNKIYLEGVEHFDWLSHNLLTMVLCNPVHTKSNFLYIRAYVRLRLGAHYSQKESMKLQKTCSNDRLYCLYTAAKSHGWPPNQQFALLISLGVPTHLVLHFFVRDILSIGKQCAWGTLDVRVQPTKGQ